MSNASPGWLPNLFEALVITTNGGAALPKRGTLDIIGADGTTVTAVDDPANNTTHVTFDSPGGIGGVAITGTPTVGQSPVATSPTSAVWGTPLPPKNYTAFDANHVFAWSLGNVAGTTTIHNEAPGGVTADLTNVSSGVVFGVPWVGTPSGTIATFSSGSSTHLLGASTSLTMPTYPVTFESIFQTLGAPGVAKYIFEKFGVFAFWLDTSGNINWSIVIAGSGFSNSGSGYVVQGAVNHIMATYDGATYSVYFNGELLASGAHTGALTTAATAFAIGYESNSSNDYFFGKIGMCAVSNIARPQSYARAVYQRLMGWARS